jgi:hypothetical protein
VTPKSQWVRLATALGTSPLLYEAAGITLAILAVWFEVYHLRDLESHAQSTHMRIQTFREEVTLSTAQLSLTELNLLALPLVPRATHDSLKAAIGHIMAVADSVRELERAYDVMYVRIQTRDRDKWFWLFLAGALCAGLARLCRIVQDAMAKSREPRT